MYAGIEHDEYPISAKLYFKQSGENLFYLILGHLPVFDSMLWQIGPAAGI